MAVDQIDRLLNIINTLCNRRRTTVSELTREYGVSQKTIRRDLARLSTIFPVTDNREGRRKYWSLIDGFKNIPPITFTPVELYVLKESTRFLKELGDPFLRPGLTSVTHKIKATFDQSKSESFENLRRVLAVRITAAKDYSKKKEFLNQLFTAASEQRSVEIGYRGLKDSKPLLRKVDPYKLWYQDGSVYLIGLCHLRNQMRTFTVDRIAILNLTNKNFLIPEDFDFQEYMQHSFSVMIEDPIHVKIRFTPEIARYIEEREWHPSQKTRKHKDGSLLMELTVGGTLEIKRWILSFGPQVEVLEPPELIEKIKEDLQNMQETYNPEKMKKKMG